MPEFVSASEAVAVIKDGDFIGVNAFLTLVNPEHLLGALGARFDETAHPNNLTIFCEAGFGNWEEDSSCEHFIAAGAVKSVVMSHFASMPATVKMIMNNEIAGYNILFGAMSHMVRAAAAGQPHYITKSGLNLYIDTKYGGSKINEKATEEWVGDVEIDGQRYLKYKTPKFDIALIKGTSCDRFGNITMEKESCTLDAMSLAQATKRNGGKVIVQVEHFSQKRRPWECIVPGAFVDYIVLCPDQQPILGIDQFEPAYAGERFMSPDEITEFVLKHGAEKVDAARSIITRRAVQELKSGMFVNIGIGIPEGVAVEAAKKNLLSSIVLTVEDGAIGGMPASGKSFGSAVDAHCIINTAQMFDFYDGGGLDICFIGGLEIDRLGNVNGHYSPKKLAGIGGFANITQHSKKVVFCTTFTASGLVVENNYGNIKIVEEGKINKVVDHVNAISFAAQNAYDIDQEVIYVTERCVFKLTKKGLTLSEVYSGIDMQKDILDKIPFEINVELEQ